MYYFTPEPKWSSMEWHQKGSPVQKFRTQPSSGKIMTSVFWDSEGIVHIDFLPCDVTIYAQHYKEHGYIKMDLREVGWYGRDWIDLAQDRDRWRAYVNAVMNLRVP
jgi:hypothetical protein